MDRMKWKMTLCMKRVTMALVRGFIHEKQETKMNENDLLISSLSPRMSISYTFNSNLSLKRKKNRKVMFCCLFAIK